MKKGMNVLIICVLLNIVFCAVAFANPEWEVPLKEIKKSILESVAPKVAILAIIGIGVNLLANEDIKSFTRQLIFLVLICGLLIGAGKIMDSMQKGMESYTPKTEVPVAIKTV